MSSCHAVRSVSDGRNANRISYERLKNYPDYHSVEYDPLSGGVKATHNGHITHFSDKEPTSFGEENLTSTELELLCQDIIFHKGHSCILLNETKLDADGYQLPQLDTETDGEVMDIRAITEKGEKTIRNALNSKKRQLKNFNNKTGADCHSVILYFHDASMFDEAQIIGQLGQTLQKVMCVFRNGEIKVYKKS